MSKTMSATCMFCSSEVAVGFCNTCDCVLGSNCLTNHKKLPVFADHITVELDEVRALEDSADEQYSSDSLKDTIISLEPCMDIHLQKCSNHGTENQTLYCVIHDIAICGRCLRLNHKSCLENCVDLYEVAVDGTRLSETIATLNEFEKEIEEYEKAIQLDKKINDTSQSNSLEVLNAFCSKLMQRLTELKETAVLDCAQKHELTNEHLDHELEKSEAEKLLVTKRKQFIEELVQRHHDRHLYVEIARFEKEKNKISARIKGLRLGKHVVQFSLKPNDELENLLFNEIHNIGTIHERINGSDEVTDDELERDFLPQGQGDNLTFYRREIVSRPFPGSYEEDMLARKGDCEKQENTHSYIQCDQLNQKQTDIVSQGTASDAYSEVELKPLLTNSHGNESSVEKESHYCQPGNTQTKALTVTHTHEKDTKEDKTDKTEQPNRQSLPADTKMLKASNDNEHDQVHIENKFKESKQVSNLLLINEIDTTADSNNRNGRKSRAGSKMPNVPYRDIPGKAVTIDFAEETEVMNNSGTPEALKDSKTDDHKKHRVHECSERSAETKIEIAITTSSYLETMLEQDIPSENTQNHPVHEPQQADKKESCNEHSANEENMELLNTTEDADKSSENMDDAATTIQKVLPLQAQSETNNDTPDRRKSSNYSRENKQKNPLRKEANLNFYRNEIASRPSPGSYVEDMLAWKGDFKQLERSNSYIQWLFPIPGSSGLNYSAQELFDYEAKEIIEDCVAHARVLRAYKMMLHFYGMKLENEVSGEIRRREENWEDRFAHLNTSYHNCMRITRILTSLGHMGYERFQQLLVRFIMAEAMVNKKLPNLNSNSMDYWIEAIKNGDELFAMMKLRKDMQNKPENFDRYGNPLPSDQLRNKQTDIAQGTAVDSDPVEQLEPKWTQSTGDESSVENKSHSCQIVNGPSVSEGQEPNNDHEYDAKTADEKQLELVDIIEKKIDYAEKGNGVLLQPGNTDTKYIIEKKLDMQNKPENYDKYGYPFKGDQTNNILTPVDAVPAVERQPQGTIITVEADSVDHYGNPINSNQLKSNQNDVVAQGTAGDAYSEVALENKLTKSTGGESSVETESYTLQIIQGPSIAGSQKAYNDYEYEEKTADETQRELRDIIEIEIEYADKGNGVLLQPENTHTEALTLAHTHEKETKEHKIEGNVEKDVKEKDCFLYERSNDETKIENSETNLNSDNNVHQACDQGDEIPDVNAEQHSECKVKSKQDSVDTGEEKCVEENNTDLLETEVLALTENFVSSATANSISKPNSNEDSREKPPCKDRDDEHCLGENVEFYRNKLVKGADRIIEDMLKLNFDTLHSNDVYWFWLFPVPKSDDITPNLSPHEAIAIQNDAAMHGRVLRAFKMALDFFGMELVVETRIIRRCQSTWEMRYKYWQDMESRRVRNCYRITRILTSLCELGYEHLQGPFVEFLMIEVLINKSLKKISKESLGPWINAIQNEDIRNTLLHEIGVRSA